MPAAKNSYIEEELQWLEDRANEIKMDVEKHPYNKIRDRIVSLSMPSGNVEKVAATKESIQEATRKALKDYAFLIEAIDKLREKEAVKVESRGKGEVSALAEDFLSGRK